MIDAYLLGAYGGVRVWGMYGGKFGSAPSIGRRLEIDFL